MVAVHQVKSYVRETATCTDSRESLSSFQTCDGTVADYGSAMSWANENASYSESSTLARELLAHHQG